MMPVKRAGLYIGILCSLLQGTKPKAPEPQLVAQGEYSAVQDVPGGAALTLDHWFMYRMPDGAFKVDIEIKTVRAPDHAEEHLTFSKAMKRRTYEWKYEWKTREEPQDKIEAAAFRCDFADAEARCAGTTISGRTFSTSLAIQAPYSFMPITDEALFDFPWSFQAWVWQVERSPNRTSSIALIFLNGEAENGTVLQSVPDKFGLLRYLGKETIEIAKQKVNAHKFEAKGVKYVEDKPEEGLVYFWFSDSGLLLKIKGSGEGFPGTFVLSRYEGPAL